MTRKEAAAVFGVAAVYLLSFLGAWFYEPWAERPTVPPAAQANYEAAVAVARAPLPLITIEPAPSIPDEFSSAEVHDRGPAACGRVAFYRRPGGEWLASADVRMPDGTRPQPGSLVRCGACGRYISQPVIELVSRRRVE